MVLGGALAFGVYLCSWALPGIGSILGRLGQNPHAPHACRSKPRSRPAFTALIIAFLSTFQLATAWANAPAESAEDAQLGSLGRVHSADVDA